MRNPGPALVPLWRRVQASSFGTPWVRPANTPRSTILQSSPFPPSSPLAPANCTDPVPEPKITRLQSSSRPTSPLAPASCTDIVSEPKSTKFQSFFFPPTHSLLPTLSGTTLQPKINTPQSFSSFATQYLASCNDIILDPNSTTSRFQAFSLSPTHSLPTPSNSLLQPKIIRFQAFSSALQPKINRSQAFSSGSTPVLWEASGDRGEGRERGGETEKSVLGVHVFECQDRSGIVAKISECIAANRGNLLNIDLFVEQDALPHPLFYSRSEFSFDPTTWARHQMTSDFNSLGVQFNASRSSVHVLGQDPNLKVAILASKQDHCLVDLLHRWQDGLLHLDIACVISNHERKSNTHVMRFLDRHGIPYHHLPTTSSPDKREAEILSLVQPPLTDFLVLARYMQVLSPGFLEAYGKDIINIHHGLLPSFKGAKPYLQAYQAGVKLIGATSHFVTPRLDEGPIIEQLVDRVSHRDTLPSFAIKSKLLEQQCLSQAVKYYVEQKIIRYSGNKTIVFS